MMLKARPCRLLSSRALRRRIVRARVPQAAAIDPRQARLFDNVDESTPKRKRTVKRDPPPPVERFDAEDWVEDKKQAPIEWGGDEGRREETSEERTFKENGTSYYKASSISVLYEADKEKVLPLIPLGEQAGFYSPKELSAKLAWWGAALCGCVLFANSATWIAALSLSVPIVLPWGLAGLRNWELQSSGKTAFVGIWHCQVLAVEALEAPSWSGTSFGLREESDMQKMIRLVIGDPWSGGARTEMVVPISEREETPNVGELCDLLVLSKRQDFRDFQAVREAFFPQMRIWLAEYPFINRDNFYQLICAIQRQQNEVNVDQELWQPVTE